MDPEIKLVPVLGFLKQRMFRKTFNESEMIFMLSNSMEEIVSHQNSEAIYLYFTCEKEGCGYIQYSIDDMGGDRDNIDNCIYALKVAKNMGMRSFPIGKDHIPHVISAMERLDLPVFYSLWELDILEEWKDYPFILTPLDVISIVYKEHYDDEYNRDEDIRLLERFFSKDVIRDQARYISWSEEEMEVWIRNGYNF